jgi:ribosomal protein S12 methylthiotransferase accessory factor
MCLALGDGKAWPGVTVALAANLSPRAAVRGAIFEQGQVGPYLARLMANGQHTIPREPDEVRTLTDHALYYFPANRLPIFDFLRSAVTPVPMADLAEPPVVSLEACTERLRMSGVRVGIADLTAPDVAQSPFRVVRALGADMQPIDFGFGVRRLPCLRLQTMLSADPGLNPHPHPLA